MVLNRDHIHTHKQETHTYILRPWKLFQKYFSIYDHSGNLKLGSIKISWNNNFFLVDKNEYFIT